MSTTNGYMHGKGRKILNMVIEETQHTDLKKLAIADHQSVAKVVRELLRQGLDTRHGLSTRKVAARVEESVDALIPEISQLRQEIGELKTLIVTQQQHIDRTATQTSTILGTLDSVVKLLDARLPEKKKGWI